MMGKSQVDTDELIVPELTWVFVLRCKVSSKGAIVDCGMVMECHSLQGQQEEIQQWGCREDFLLSESRQLLWHGPCMEADPRCESKFCA